MRKSFIKVLWAILVTGIGIVAIFFFLIWFGIVGYSPDIENLQNPISKSASQVFSADGKIITSTAPTVFPFLILIFRPTLCRHW